ncbi:MAG: 2,4-dihydroxyhept-2-ene-1,7-dioic acid aldolase [Clostridiales bacterium]|nr:2,4-dihydroxyhept-2-ene-1,7-dioic acid aldolase [Clostridiales bacterium]
MDNRIHECMKKGIKTVSTRVISTKPYIMEIIGGTGHYDYAEFLAEYSTFSQEDLENMVRAAELYQMGTMIKIDYQNRLYVAQKAAASGFQAVLFTDHRNAEQVRESIAALRPDTPFDQGSYGFSTRRFIKSPKMISALAHAERIRKIVCCFMIEKKEAIQNIEEICSVPGVDMVQFGGYDYCMSQGWEVEDHKEDIRNAERRMIEVALGHGVRPRCEIYRSEDAEYYESLGVKDFSLNIENFILQDYWEGEGAKLRKLLK